MDNLLPLGLENIDPDKPIFSITIVSEALNIHPRTLRIYDEENLLVPERATRSKRLYSLNDIEKGKLIQYLSRNIGINLPGIKLFLCMLDDLDLPINKGIKYISGKLDKMQITEEEQLENIKKHSNKGRKAKAAKENIQ